MKIAHLTTVDLSLRYLVLPQLLAARPLGESIGISAPGEFVGDLEEMGIRHVALPSSTRGMNLVEDLKAMRQLWSILKAERPDVLHTHNPKPGVYGRILGRLAGVPIVVNTVHGLYATEESNLVRRLVVYGLEAIASRFSDSELVQNPEDMRTLGRLKIVTGDKLRLLGNGVDLDTFNPGNAAASRASKRAELGLREDDVAIGMVGRLVAEKGVPELIEAVRVLGDGVRVFIVGPGDPDKADAIDAEVLESGAEAGVEFLGMRRDVADLYGAFDIFALPSHREGFPRAAMEAAASGLPLVLTDIRGCRQVVDHGVNGFLVPVESPLALAEALQTIVSDEGLRRRMGSASAERAIREFDENRVVEIVLDTYEQIAREKGLAWGFGERAGDVALRTAEAQDARTIGALHSTLIDTGFLSSLGDRFLELLYSALVQYERAEVVVAESGGAVVGFVAGVGDTGDFYKAFLRTHFLSALWLLLPALLKPKTWARVWETLRYGSADEAGSAELLSMAVAPAARGRGVGVRLVEELLARARNSGIESMKVIVGAGNTEARGLYTKCGFGEPRELEVHRGMTSLEMTWKF